MKGLGEMVEELPDDLQRGGQDFLEFLVGESENPASTATDTV